MPLAVMSNSICQVSFAEPALLRRVRDRKRASVGHSREHPGAAAGATVAAAGGGVFVARPAAHRAPPDHPGPAAGPTVAAAGVGVLLAVPAAAGAWPSSWCSALSVRVVSLPPG